MKRSSQRRADPGDYREMRAGRKVANLSRAHGITEERSYSRWTPNPATDR